MFFSAFFEIIQKAILVKGQLSKAFLVMFLNFQTKMYSQTLQFDCT